MDTTLGWATLLTHGDVDPEEPGVISPPLHQSVNYAAATAEQFTELNERIQPPRYYRRFGNPTQARLEELLAKAEGADAALATASGMGAVTTTLLTLLSAGDHVVAQHSMYGGTLSMLRTLGKRFGIEVSFVDQTDTAAFEASITDRTKLFMLETPSNPLLALTDLDSVAALARARGILTWVDNTVATPINQKPLDHGVDLVMHSLTKAIGGHADLQAGVLIGRAELVERLWLTHTMVGAVTSPFDAWLALRGLRTLAMRVEWQNRSAQSVADYLAGRPEVLKVNYPGLATHPQHELARRQMRGYGCLLSFEVDGGRPAAERLIAALHLAARAPSLGGTTTTIVRPAAMWSNELTEEQLATAGVPSGLIRFAVGLEDQGDLIADLDQAFASLPPVGRA